MPQQKALLLEKAFGNLVIGLRDIPKPGPKDLLVKILATALNPVDWKIQKYGIIFTEYPAVLGTDAAGTVEAVGDEVHGFSVGDNVFHQGYFTIDAATFQQYAVVPAEIVAKIPHPISFDQAASIPLGLATAAIGLYGDVAGPEQLVAPWDEGGKGKYAGRPIVIFGGSTSVGQYAIQLAKLSGFSPIITTASLSNAAYVQSLGATHVLDRRNAQLDVAAAAAQIVGDAAPIDVVYDAVAVAETQKAAWDLLAPGGRVTLVLPAAVDKDLYKDKHIVNVFGNVHTEANRPFGVKMYSKLTQLLQDGAIQPNRVEVLPNGLQGIPEGLKRMENDKVSGVKLIARPFETA